MKSLRLSAGFWLFLCVFSHDVHPVKMSEFKLPIFRLIDQQDLVGMRKTIETSPHLLTKQFIEGKTLLHYAVARSKPLSAACLLMLGIDWKINDARGKNALKRASKVLLHEIRDVYQRMPDPQLQLRSISPFVAKKVKELNERGVVRLSGYLSSHDLEELRDDFDKEMAVLERKSERGLLTTNPLRERFYKKKEKVIATNNPFKNSKMLTKICCDQELYQIICQYLGKDVYIIKAWGSRYYAVGKQANVGVFQWHHDSAGKRVKIMILLRDVTENDRFIAYVPGSHKLKYSFEQYGQNKFGIDYCKKHMDHVEIFNGTGNAGDIFIFDTNGIHRGTTSENGGRDAYLVSYTSDKSHVWGLDVDQEYINSIVKTSTNPFERVIQAKKQRSTFAPYYKRWVRSLCDPQSWV